VWVLAGVLFIVGMGMVPDLLLNRYETLAGYDQRRVSRITGKADCRTCEVIGSGECYRYGRWRACSLKELR
jgi:hypothetical protein